MASYALGLRPNLITLEDDGYRDGVGGEVQHVKGEVGLASQEHWPTFR